jgi:hypothetical protein
MSAPENYVRRIRREPQSTDERKIKAPRSGLVQQLNGRTTISEIARNPFVVI